MSSKPHVLRMLVAKWWQPAFELVQTNWNWICILFIVIAGASAAWAICRSVEHLAELEFRDGLDS